VKLLSYLPVFVNPYQVIMTTLADLVKLRNLQKGRMTRMQTTINKHDVTPLDQTTITDMNKALTEFSEKVTQIQEKICVLCTTDLEVEAQADVSDWFDQKISEIKSKLFTIQSTLAPVATAGARSSVKLPRVELPSFNGNFDNWQSFQDLFIATVHNNTSLSGAQKLQYLKSCLCGEASHLIKSFTVTDQNYTEAWGILTDRYDNKREIVNSIIKRLHNQHVLKSESAYALQKLIDTTNECLRSLKVLGRATDQWDDLIVYLVTDKMDPESRREWAKTLKGVEPSTFKELSDFIDNHIRGLMAGGQKSNPATNRDSNRESRVHLIITREDKLRLKVFLQRRYVQFVKQIILSTYASNYKQCRYQIEFKQ
jgi:hypothetical protein